MVKVFLISFSDNFKEKTKNPFLGTYLLVWLIRNWDLIYSLLNFDSNLRLKDKITFVNDYYNKTDFVENLLINIYWSFGLLILTYLLVNISRFIVNLSEKRLTPWIYKITDSKSIVLKEEYERIRAESDDLQNRLDKERETKSRLEARIKSLENEIIEVSKIKSETNNGQMDVFKPSNSEDRTDVFINRLKAKNYIDEFLKLCLSIQRGETILNDNKSLDYLLQLGLLIYKSQYSTSAKYYSITKDGEKVLEKIRLDI